MRQLLKNPLAIATLVAAVGIPTAAYAADNVGSLGRVNSITIHNSTADTHKQWHGQIKVKDKSGTTKYRWGGTACPGLKLPDSMVDNLVHAFKSRNRTRILPKWKKGQGSNKCLVGFELRTVRKNDGGPPPTPPDEPPPIGPN